MHQREFWPFRIFEWANNFKALLCLSAAIFTLYEYETAARKLVANFQDFPLIFDWASLICAYFLLSLCLCVLVCQL